MDSPPTFPRRPSGPWGRLRAPPTDFLESCGLPSKGDNKLLDPKTQETYYAKLVERYMQFCASAGRHDDTLAKAFSSLSVSNAPTRSSPSPNSKPTPSPIPSSPSPQTTTPPAPAPLPSSSSTTTTTTTSKELSTLLLSTRKLREGLLASRRHDLFSQRAHIFSIRLAILCHSAENYAPALSTLLHLIHPLTPLPTSELHEFVAYAVLDLACRQRDFHAAFAALGAWRRRGARLDDRLARVVRALVHDDWVAFWRVRGEVDGYFRGIMGFAEDAVRRKALKGVGSAYLSVERGFVEGCVGGMAWEEVRVREGVGWEEDGGRIVVRRVRGRAVVGVGAR